MVILGLGSNVGDRLAFLRQALCHIQQLPAFSVKQVSPVYLSDALLLPNASSEWDKPYLNVAVRGETSLTPLALLHAIKKIEKTIGRDPTPKWGPRPIDIDILAIDHLVHVDNLLHLPHEHLVERPFALWPLADVAPHWIYPVPGPHYGKTAAELSEQWASRFNGKAPLCTRQLSHRIDTPELVGIINVTPDSFSQDGLLSVEVITEKAKELVEAGATILDLGAEATNPAIRPVNAETEWKRLAPVLENIMSQKSQWFLSPAISIDTRHVSTAKNALALGVDWINDVSGLQDKKMIGLLADHDIDMVFMHQLGLPANKKQVVPPTQDIVDTVLTWAKEKIAALKQQGIFRERLIFDVGIGFGKTASQSMTLLQQIHRFTELETRLIVGHSRKSFLQLFTPLPPAERECETAAISLFLSQQSINYVRIHNVAYTSRVLKIWQALKSNDVHVQSTLQEEPSYRSAKEN